MGVMLSSLAIGSFLWWLRRLWPVVLRKMLSHGVHSEFVWPMLPSHNRG